MSQKRNTAHSARRLTGASSTQEALDPRALAKLAALGFLSALGALFLWHQLVLTRSGGMPFCPTGEDAGCATLWDSAFATAVHRMTGLPIAGWGLVWGVTAFVFPWLSLLRLAQHRPTSTLVWAGRWTGVAGLLVMVLMISVSLVERSFCSGCVVIYALVFWYGGVTLTNWQRMPLREARRGLALAAGASAVVFVLLLYPGLKTLRITGSETEKEDFTGSLWKSPGTGDPVRDRQITSLVASLTPQLKQTLSDSLYIYRSSPGLTLPPLRTFPSKDAPVRITEFTDVLCRHCAKLHAMLDSLHKSVPPGSFILEERQYPLDPRCNPDVLSRHGRSARCLAAAARICLEARGRGIEFSSALFESQAVLTEERVYDLAAPYLSRPDLDRCAGSPQTQAELAEDLAFARRYRPEGVPLVVVNGHRGTSFEPFLKAVVLSRGAAFHPAFEALPEPVPRVDFR